jgi:hypothetical protein
LCSNLQDLREDFSRRWSCLTTSLYLVRLIDSFILRQSQPSTLARSNRNWPLILLTYVRKSALTGNLEPGANHRSKRVSAREYVFSRTETGNTETYQVHYVLLNSNFITFLIMHCTAKCKIASFSFQNESWFANPCIPPSVTTNEPKGCTKPLSCLSHKINSRDRSDQSNTSDTTIAEQHSHTWSNVLLYSYISRWFQS